MIIDADGLFNGNRWRKCSNFARLNAPYLLLASNGFGRLEIDPARIIGRAYLTFRPRPTEDEIMALLREYIEAHLLFIYQSDGQIWGQWDTPDRLLARYRTAADLRSPAPPKELFNQWMSSYHSAESKNQQVTENFRNISKVSENFETFLLGVGEGVGEGNGDGKNICASSDARVCDSTPISSKRKHPASEATKEQAEWFDEWWAIYWLAKAKKPALKAFAHHVKDRQRFDEVMAATKAQKPGMMKREPEHRPHGATWLNAERWTDSVTEEKRSDAVLDEIYGKLKENW